MSIDREAQLARAIVRRHWASTEELSPLHLGGEGRRTWKVGAGLWLTASHDAPALARENELLVRLSKTDLPIREPLPVPTVDGNKLVVDHDHGWRMTRHIPGHRPDGESAEFFRASGCVLSALHRTLSGLIDARPVAASPLESVRDLVEHALGAEWATVTDDTTERDDVLRIAAWLKSHLHRLDQLQPQLIHGDWSTPNLLVGEDDSSRIVAVLDWQFATVAPVICDLAQSASSILMWSELPNKSEVIREMLDAYGMSDASLLGVSMAAFWFWNYWNGRAELEREPRSRDALNRQPGRLRTVLAFADAWG